MSLFLSRFFGNQFVYNVIQGQAQVVRQSRDLLLMLGDLAHLVLPLLQLWKEERQNRDRRGGGVTGMVNSCSIYRQLFNKKT